MSSYWNTILRWGLAGSWEGGEKLGLQPFLFLECMLFNQPRAGAWLSRLIELVFTNVCFELPPASHPSLYSFPSLSSSQQSLSRSFLWAAFCLWPATPGKRTRAVTPLYKTASIIPEHTGGLPACQGRVTMATKLPSTMEWGSTGRTSCSFIGLNLL